MDNITKSFNDSVNTVHDELKSILRNWLQSNGVSDKQISNIEIDSILTSIEYRLWKHLEPPTDKE